VRAYLGRGKRRNAMAEQRCIPHIGCCDFMQSHHSPLGERLRWIRSNCDALQKRGETDTDKVAAPDRGRIQESPKAGQISYARLPAWLLRYGGSTSYRPDKRGNLTISSNDTGCMFPFHVVSAPCDLGCGVTIVFSVLGKPVEGGIHTGKLRTPKKPNTNILNAALKNYIF